LHILLLPSWYPGTTKLEGIFIYEQALALSKLGNLTVSILNWGPNEFVLKIRDPLQSIINLKKKCITSEHIIKHKSNLIEYKFSHLTWTSRFRAGNYQSLAKRLIKILPGIEHDIGRIDLIHAHVTFPGGFLASYISEQLSIPFVITEHSGPFPFSEYVTKEGISDILTKPLNKASQVISVSNWLAQSISKFTLSNPIVIPNSVDTDFFTPLHNHVSSHDVPIIFCLSSLTNEKGISDLLQAIKIVKDNGHNFLIRLGGTGPKKKKYLKLAESLDIQSRIQWLGFLTRQEALEEYQKCDFFVMPSRLESLSMVILEALACGKPVVSTNCGGPAELITYANGIMAEPGNALSLAASLEKMLIEFPSYNSQQIRHSCEERFSEKVIVQKLFNVYLGIINKV
jgi:glycosyltransferase involved in cell wall biosynthesis